MNEESILTGELKSWIGRKTERRVLDPVDASLIRRCVDATGDANPLWLDDEYARTAGHRKRILPPLLVGWETFRNRGGARDDGDPDDFFVGCCFPKTTFKPATPARKSSGSVPSIWAKPFPFRRRSSISRSRKARPE
jgi:hypothetical protein